MAAAKKKPGDLQQEHEKERWELRLKKADWWYKVLIMTLGSFLAGSFFVYQYRQTESRLFTDLMSSRETADSNLRAEMFKTLFDAYFKSKVNPPDASVGMSDKQSAKPSGAADGSVGTSDKQSAQPYGATLEKLRHEVMLTDVIARNFDSIDIRPIFEDLDRKLEDSIGESRQPDAGQIEAFKLRESLRRVAIGATERQIASLKALEGQAAASVSHHKVLFHCASDASPKIINQFPKELLTLLGSIDVKDGDGDGTLLLYVWEHGEVRPPRELRVSFYDMPALENLQLTTGQRVAFSLNTYVSKDYCDRFSKALDPQTRKYCVDFDPLSDVCAIAGIRVVLLPRTFLGLHDRPYQNDLAAGRYRETPWWKFW